MAGIPGMAGMAGMAGIAMHRRNSTGILQEAGLRYLGMVYYLKIQQVVHSI